MGRIAARLGTDMAIRKLKPKPGQKTPVRFAVSGEPIRRQQPRFVVNSGWVGIPGSACWLRANAASSICRKFAKA